MAWTLAGSWDYSSDVASVTFTSGLSTYSEVLVLMTLITLQNSGRPIVRVSSNSGSSYYAASGDYISIATTGVESNATSLISTAADATAARSGAIQIFNFSSASADEKFAERLTVDSNRQTRLTMAAALNALEIIASNGGNLTGGKIRVFGR